MSQIIVLLLASIASLIAFLLALRGRWETIPATCRRCGYDVSHRPAGIDVCSECGTDLTKPKAVRTRRRRRRPAGVAFFGLAAAVALAFLSVEAARFHWTPWLLAKAPNAVLLRLARHDLNRGDALREELLRRGPPTPALIDHLLDVHEKGKFALFGAVEGAPVKAAVEGQMSPAQLDRFARLAFGPVAWRVRPVVCVGEPIHLYGDLGGTGFGSMTLPQTTKFGFEIDRPATPDTDLTGRQRHSRLPRLTVTPERWSGKPLARGPHTLHVVVRRQFHHPDRLDQTLGPAIDQALIIPVQVVGPDEPIAPASPDHALGRTLREVIGVSVERTASRLQFKMTLNKAAPAEFGFRVEAVVDGVAYPVGLWAARKGESGVAALMSIPLAPPRLGEVERLTVRLVGNDHALNDRIDITSYWPGTIDFDEVPVTPPTPNTSAFPSTPAPMPNSQMPRQQ